VGVVARGLEETELFAPPPATRGRQLQEKQGGIHSQRPPPKSDAPAQLSPKQQNLVQTHLEVIQDVSVGTQLRPGRARSNKKEGEEANVKWDCEREWKRTSLGWRFSLAFRLGTTRFANWD
jgi:hypothetical protein